MAAPERRNVVFSGRELSVATSERRNVFLVGRFRWPHLTTGNFFSGRAISMAAPERRNVFFSGREISVATCERRNVVFVVAQFFVAGVLVVRCFVFFWLHIFSCKVVSVARCLCFWSGI